MTDYSELVDRYKKYRKITRKLNSSLTERISKKAMEECGRKLGIMKSGTFVFRDMDEGAVLMDHCIYDYYENGSNAISRFLAEFSRSDSDEDVALKAMSESFYTLVQVEDVLPGVGVQVDDLFSDRSFLITDIGFSKTAVRGLVLATRLICFEDFAMTSGAALVVGPETLAEIFDFMDQNFRIEDSEYILDMQQRIDLTARIIRLCLQDETGAQIEYQDVETEPVTLPLRKETHVGRNEPCPCGSGKKHKHCCGR